MKLTHGELTVTCDRTVLMSGSDLLEHRVCSSLIKSVSSSENTDKPMGSLEKEMYPVNGHLSTAPDPKYQFNGSHTSELCHWQ